MKRSIEHVDPKNHRRQNANTARQRCSVQSSGLGAVGARLNLSLRYTLPDSVNVARKRPGCAGAIALQIQTNRDGDTYVPTQGWGWIGIPSRRLIRLEVTTRRPGSSPLKTG